MRQLLYISTSVNSAIGDQLFNILASSRRNNAANGLTGLLWTDGQRFLQVLEGTSLELNATFMRIRADSRHRAVVVLHDRVITERTFGQWAMALADDTDERIDTALRNASPEVCGTFEGLITARRAARGIEPAMMSSGGVAESAAAGPKTRLSYLRLPLAVRGAEIAGAGVRHSI